MEITESPGLSDSARAPYRTKFRVFSGEAYIALFSSFIACGVWEAVYILDGLLQHRSEIRPDTLHAETQGQSETVFGLAYL